MKKSKLTLYKPKTKEQAEAMKPRVYMTKESLEKLKELFKDGKVQGELQKDGSIIMKSSKNVVS